MAWLLALLVCGLGTLTGCSAGSSVKPPPSADQLLTFAFQDFSQQSSYHLTGSFDSSGKNIVVDLTSVGSDAASGHFEDPAKGPLWYVLVGGKTYLGGDWPTLPFSPAMRKYFTGKWITDSDRAAADPFGADPGPLLRKLASKSDISDAFLRGATGMKVKTAKLEGKSVTELESEQEQVYLSGTTRPRLLQITRPAGAPSQDGFTEVALSFGDFGTTSKIDVPQDVVDIGDLAQMPASYQSQKGSFQFVSCGYSSCGAKLTVINTAGKIAADPPPSATFTFKKGDGTFIDSCTVPIPLVDHNATSDVSCSVSSAAWRSCYYGGGEYVATGSISNPLYDESGNGASA